MSWNIVPASGVSLAELPHASGRYYTSVLITGAATLALGASTLYAIPFFVPQTTTYTSINIETTAAAALKVLRLGIYNDNGGVPGSLVLDAGTVSMTTPTGGKAIVISQTLAAGWYWLACVGDGTPTVRAISQTNSLPWLGYTSGTDVTNHVGWSVAFTYAALPDPFTGGGALMTTAAPRLTLGV